MDILGVLLVTLFCIWQTAAETDAEKCARDAPFKQVVVNLVNAANRANDVGLGHASDPNPGPYLTLIRAIQVSNSFLSDLFIGNTTMTLDCVSISKQVAAASQVAGFNSTDVFKAPGNATGEDLFHSLLLDYGVALTTFYQVGNNSANATDATKYESLIIRAAADRAALTAATDATSSTPACLASAKDLGLVIVLISSVLTDNSTDCNSDINPQPPSSVSTVAPVEASTAAGGSGGSSAMPTSRFTVTGSAGGATSAPATEAPTTGYDAY